MNGIVCIEEEKLLEKEEDRLIVQISIAATSQSCNFFHIYRLYNIFYNVDSIFASINCIFTCIN